MTTADHSRDCSQSEISARYGAERLPRPTDLKEAHRQHPFICVWDDHESANDAYRHGAEKLYASHERGATWRVLGRGLAEPIE